MMKLRGKQVTSQNLRRQICDLHEREVIDCEAAVEVVDHIVVEDGHPGEGGAIDLGEVERLEIRDS